MPVTTPHDHTPATPEEIWAILREMAREQRESAIDLEDIKAIIQTTAKKEAKRWEEEAKRREEEAIKEAKRREEEAIKEAKRREEEAIKEAKYRESMKALDKKIGWLTNRFGEVVEHLVAPGIMDKFNEMGLGLTSVSENKKIKDPKTKQHIAEVDIMLEGPDIFIAVSVKTKAKDDDINEHIKQMEKLRQFADSQNEKRSYLGGIASAVTSDSLRSSILKAGFYAIEQAGDTMRINVPVDFKPRKW